MIDDQTYCAIHDHQTQHGLNAAQIAEALDLDARTVSTWLAGPRFRQRQSTPRTSKLDPHKATIRRWLEGHRYSAQQSFQRLCEEEDYRGGISIVKDYVRTVRPPCTSAFLTLSFAPGECAQVDWGSWEAVPVGETRRRLSLFVMVLCYSRMLYVEFTLSQTMEQFLACHQNAFAFFGNRVPEKVMVDNLKSAVLRHTRGEAPVLNARYVDFAQHYGFRVIACNPGKGNEKGRVESGVGYVKKNFLNGLDITDFSAVNPPARVWMDTIANVRIHGETHQRPVDRFAEERSVLHAGPEHPYDVAQLVQVRASPSFRVRWDTNRY
ncbi:IS21 family transposase [Thiorhodococcus mannitoliphagus]|uniref:IS21 family transposase n=1 Tax=Thiorhodococcus mannitoliphagus TaxID=329406 RepID=UPI00197D7149|nr:IS21 family transposase [Thiorhodococcus mannitoliphagus]